MMLSKRLAERTSAIEAASTRVATKASDPPRTSPGRLLEAQMQLNEAESERDAATRPKRLSHLAQMLEAFAKKD